MSRSWKAKQALGATVALVVISILSMMSVAGKEPTPVKSENQAVELLKERLDLLVQVATLQRCAYERGEASFDSALGAETDVLLAKLELATTPTERIAIRESLVETARQLEELAKRLFDAREGSQVDYLKAQAQRLRSEAELIRERL